MSRGLREGLKILLPVALAVAALLFVHASWACLVWTVLAALLVFGLYFFRDPERIPPADEALILAAADGRVVEIAEVDETAFNLGRMKRVAIFLSIFDVHVNRTPATGQVAKIVYTPGAFLDVRHPEASARNEAMAWRIDTARGPLVVRQIAGLIARRIVAWTRGGDQLARGARFGMIRFGSRTEIYLPPDCPVLVRVGECVKGGETAIARWPGPNQ